MDDDKQLLVLSPGFKFNPSDEELVKYYLRRKLLGKKLSSLLIPEVDVYKYAPWDLPRMAGWKGEQSRWYFFCPRIKKYCGSGRSNRAIDVGYWKSTGKDRHVGCRNEAVGIKKTLVFYRGRLPSGERTDWVMHEYRMEEKVLDGCEADPDHELVLCGIFRKNGAGPKTSLQGRGTLRKMDAISDDDDDDLLLTNNSMEPAMLSQGYVSQSEATPLASKIVPPVIDMDAGTLLKNADADVGEALFPSSESWSSELCTLGLCSFEILDGGPSDLLAPASLSLVERGASGSETTSADRVLKSIDPESTTDDKFPSAGKLSRKDILSWTHKVRIRPTWLSTDDGFSWRKYGQKFILGAKYPRSYHRCAYKHIQGCLATKIMQRSDDDIDVFEVTYHGKHTCNVAQTDRPLLPRASETENHEQMSDISPFSFSEPAKSQEIISHDHLDTCQETCDIPSFNSFTHFIEPAISSITDYCQGNKYLGGSFPPPFMSPSTLGMDNLFELFGDGHDGFTSGASDFFFGDGHESFGNPNFELSKISNGDTGTCVSTGAEEGVINCRRHENFDLQTVDDHQVSSGYSAGRLSARYLRNLVDQLLLLDPPRPFSRNLRAECLVEVYLPGSNYALVQDLVNLEQLDLSCSSFTRMPDLSKACKLQSLDLHGCSYLVDASSIQYLTRLEYINLKGCTSLTRLPSLMALKFLLSLDVSDCINLRRLPPSLGCLSSLTTLDLTNCKRIQNLPKGILRLKSVQTLSISGCSMLMEHASGPEWMLIEHQENPIVHSSSHTSDEEVSASYHPVGQYISKLPLELPEEERICGKSNSTASKDAAEPSLTTQGLERQREALKGYMNMPVEAIHEANAFYDVQKTVGSLIRRSSDLHESASLQDLMYCLEELQENVPETMAHMHNAQVSRGSSQGKLAHLGSSFFQAEEHYSVLAARFLVISDQEDELDAEIARLLAKRQELA